MWKTKFGAILESNCVVEKEMLGVTSTSII
jgi:hypothetical protein